ncbi:MAG: DUF2892 domain-containing protein [Bacteroidetes bacterium]|nr:DUF2892 domain-containing protein [Bacteroidota bacterium]
MKKNMGSADRIIRFLLVIVIAALYFTGVINGILAVLLIAFGVIFLLTGFAGFCPLYFPFGISTGKKEKTA